MDKLILENQIAIMKALFALEGGRYRDSSYPLLSYHSDARKALENRISATEAALEVWRPAPAAVLSDLPAGMGLDGKPVDWRQEGR